MDSLAIIHSEAANSLALAMVAASSTPLLLLDGHLEVIAASSSFCRAFGIDPRNAAGRPLAALGAGAWNLPQLHARLRATVAGQGKIEAYELDFQQAGLDDRRLVLDAHKLDYEDTANIRLLLSISDVTDARLSAKLQDDLLREKSILLQELQHRVANSLQIIASVLLQSARRVESDETRNHLYDAHSRVMSIASVQRQLAASRLGTVELRPYLTDLCRSISASMIRDHDQLSLEVSADDSVATADISVSLGLMVTELVINALKHAFPGGRHGTIRVDYHASGAAWKLSVGDNGVGIPVEPFSARPGLGSSIIEAIARQLGASVEIADAAPGTAVSIVGFGERRSGDRRRAFAGQER
jgi:two-component sensor histidine kinase